MANSDMAALDVHAKVREQYAATLGAAAMALAEGRPDLVRSLVLVGGFSELDRAAALNFGLRARLIRKLGLGDEAALGCGRKHGRVRLRHDKRTRRIRPTQA